MDRPKVGFSATSYLKFTNHLKQLQTLSAMEEQNQTKGWHYQLPDGTTAPNMKKLKEITGRSVTTLRSLIRKREIKKVYYEQMLRSHGENQELRVR